MTFKKIIPRQRTKTGDIRVSFSGNKTVYANIYISVILLDNIGWAHNNRVSVYIDDEDCKKWLLQKATDDMPNTYLLSSTKVGKSGLVKLQFKFSECEIIGDNRKLKVVNYKIFSEGMDIIIPNAVN